MADSPSAVVELYNLQKSGIFVVDHEAAASGSGSRSEDAVPGGRGGGGDAVVSIKNGHGAGIPPTITESIRETKNERRHRAYRKQKVHAVLVIATLTGVSFLNTMGSGILTVALPQIAREVGLDETLLLWPPAVYSLVAGCTLLVFGAIGDVVGARRVWLCGAALYSVFTLAVGLSRTGTQLLVLRAASGLAMAMCIPTAISLTTRTFNPGPWRSQALGCQGMGQPLGYSAGLLLGGVFVDTIGWRWGFYISAILNAGLLVCGWCVLFERPQSESPWRGLCCEIDWVGVLISTTSLGLLSYVLSSIGRDYRGIRDPGNIILLIVAVGLVPAFILWARRQERLERPALIPNSIWKHAAFTSICTAVFLTWAVFNAYQYFSALYFTRVEHLAPIETSLRFLPMVIVGAATNVVSIGTAATGYLVEKVDVRTLLSVSAVITLSSPLLMAFVTPHLIYWKGAFTSMLLSPLHPDVLFTVSTLIIARAFPPESQSLAGGVFGTLAQVGNCVGLAVTAAISSAVTQQQLQSGLGVDESLLKGYHATFWTCFATMVWVVPIVFFGHKKGERAGSSRPRLSAVSEMNPLGLSSSVMLWLMAPP
ncbi:hypothetical protein SLS62_000563 [Diatrype stigma]|uniref:Major facilitator superfamily (MFS) profile domain-containing protein n=1 Tax=Diatrype stigma TaxID=117547 RepID=A0AAN9YSM6_9PEZI